MLAIPVLAVIKVLIRFLDELYLRSDFFLRLHSDGETTAELRRVAAAIYGPCEADAQRVMRVVRIAAALRSHDCGNLIPQSSILRKEPDFPEYAAVSGRKRSRRLATGIVSRPPG